jgi:hypothetical protein
MGTKRTPPPTPPRTATIPIRNVTMKRIKGHAHQGRLDPPSTGKPGASASDDAKTEVLTKNTAKTITAKNRNFK